MRPAKIYEVTHPETRQSGDRGNQFPGGKERQSETISFSQDTATKTGLTPRTIQQEVQIAADLEEGVKKLESNTAREQGRKDAPGSVGESTRIVACSLL